MRADGPWAAKGADLVLWGIAGASLAAMPIALSRASEPPPSLSIVAAALLVGALVGHAVWHAKAGHSRRGFVAAALACAAIAAARHPSSAAYAAGCVAFVTAGLLHAALLTHLFVASLWARLAVAAAAARIATAALWLVLGPRHGILASVITLAPFAALMLRDGGEGPPPPAREWLARASIALDIAMIAAARALLE